MGFSFVTVVTDGNSSAAIVLKLAELLVVEILKV